VKKHCRLALGLLMAMLLSMAPRESGRAQPIEPGYRLPWDCGREFRLGQGNDANFWDRRDPAATHAGIFALDFPMDEGTRLRAARAGVVRRVEADYTGNVSPLLGRLPPNVVEVEHADGTSLLYAHLQPGGAVVRVNDRVEAGELLGFSGHTGTSSNPHVHVELRNPQGQTVPLAFQEVPGDGQPQPGMRYRSQNLAPGQDPAACAAGLEARYGSPRLVLTTADSEELSALGNEPTLATMSQFGLADPRWTVYFTGLSVDVDEEWSVIWRDAAGRELSQQRSARAAPRYVGTTLWFNRNALSPGSYSVELSVAGQAVKRLSFTAGEERINGPLANRWLMPVNQPAVLDADAEAVMVRAQQAQRRADRRAPLLLPFTGVAADWTSRGLLPSAAAPPRVDLPASADLHEVIALGSSSRGLFLQLSARDPAPEAEVSYSLRFDADGTGTDWLQLLVDPGGIRLRDWRGAPSGTIPPLQPLSGSLYELERGAGPGGSLQLHLDLRALESHLPVRVRVQSYRSGTSESYTQMPWGRVQPLVP
jgi:hypothetical protein